MEKPIRVLLVEDSAVDSRLLQLLLGDSKNMFFAWTCVTRLADALIKLRQEEFDVVLSDLTLPDSQGFETFQALHSQAPAMPMIVLSGTDDDRMALQAVREGAQDYLVKGKVDTHILTRAITYAIERQRAERALQESERHYRHLLESITDYTYTVQIEKSVPNRTVHSPTCVSITGYTPEEYESDPDLWFEMIHPSDRPAVIGQAAEVLRGAMPPPLEHRIIHKTGHVRWVRNTVVSGRDQNGQLICYDGLISDITERKLAEENLVKSEAFYHSLVEHLPQYIFRKDLQERFTFANQRFCTMLGKSLEGITGKTDFDFYPPELAAKYQRDDRYVVRTGKIFETIEENKSPLGESLFVNVIKTPIYDSAGQIIGIQCIFWDITERKQFEERLQKANEELARSEAALRRSHDELKAAQLQLIQAEKMESIGTLAAGVAHEVKNPLAILMMGINYLNRKLSTGQDENMGVVLKEMRDAIDRADSITRGLLNFSASRQLEVRPEDLNNIVLETLRLVRHALSSNQVEVTQEFAEKLPSIAADKTQIQQVFVNIFMNAIQAMPQGGKLRVRTFSKQLTETTHFEGWRKADRLWIGDTAVVAEVEDTGSGIAEEHLAKIFDPFFTTKPTGIGTGLGLPVSKKIIELHGGSLDIRNLKEGGVRVTVILKGHRTQS
jgi:PAS domain S-box-containing protein